MVEEPAPPGSFGPSTKEPVSVALEDGAGGEHTVPVGCSEAEPSRKLTQAAAAAAEEEEEEEEEEEPDVYYFESDHLALKHNKEYVGAPRGLRSLLFFFCCDFALTHDDHCIL